MDKRCPKCGLYSTPNAQRCDCGYDFDSGTVKASYLPTPSTASLAKHTSPSVKATLAFFAAAIPTLLVGSYVGMLLAALPCADHSPQPYCSAHGGGAIFVGLGIGIVAALVVGAMVSRHVRNRPSR